MKKFAQECIKKSLLQSVSKENKTIASNKISIFKMSYLKNALLLQKDIYFMILLLKSIARIEVGYLFLTKRIIAKLFFFLYLIQSKWLTEIKYHKK